MGLTRDLHMTAQSETSSNTGPSGLRVLLVEDEVTARVALGHLLRRFGVDVLVSGDAESAARLVRALPPDRLPDVVLADYNLPGADGLALLRWIKQRSPRTRLALVTALDRVSLASLLTPGITFFRKPTPFDQILGYLDRVSAERSK